MGSYAAEANVVGDFTKLVFGRDRVRAQQPATTLRLRPSLPDLVNLRRGRLRAVVALREDLAPATNTQQVTLMGGGKLTAESVSRLCRLCHEQVALQSSVK
jgi:hypothetical protein